MRYLAVLVLALLVFPASSRGAAFGGPTGRRALDGPWTVRLDPGGHGTARGYARGAFTGRDVRIPWVANGRDVSSLAAYRGSIAWYRTTVSVGTTADYAIRFESVNHRARVWVDGRAVARHTGASLPFEADTRLSAGAHRLVVRADWRSPETMRAEGWFRSWFNFGGIDGAVTIRQLGRSQLDAPAVITRLDGGTPVVTVTARVRNRAGERPVTVTGRLGSASLRFRPVRL